MEMKDMEQAWCRQLQLEFESICYQYGIELRPPIFEITGSRQQLGCWRPEQGCLQLSRHLIRSHPWQVTLQVLRHEMAHQVCSELFARPCTGHGPDFQRACDLLGVSTPFRRARADLADSIVAETPASPGTAAGRRMLERVRKLLALAGSDNRHEAELAMEKAAELMARHNLELARADAAAGYSHLIIETGQRIMPGHRKAIGAILRDHFHVQVVCSSLYDPATDQSFRTMELLGRTENVQVAEYCYRFLEERLASLWQQNRHRYTGHPRTARNSYYLGLLRGFSERLAAMRVPRHQAGQGDKGTALLLSEADPGLQRFVRQRFPRLCRRSGRRTRVNSEAYGEAVATGRRLVLHGSVTSGDRQQGGLLE